MSLSFPPADTFDLNLFFPLQNSVSDPRSCLNVTGAFWALYIFGRQFVFGASAVCLVLMLYFPIPVVVEQSSISKFQ